MGSGCMTVIQSIILGIIQGLTEFLPISSSGHLVIIPYIFGWDIPGQQAFIFDVLVQLGTLLAVITYFRMDLYHIIRAVIEGLIRRRPFVDPDAQLGWLLLVASVPAFLVGILFKDVVEQTFTSPVAASLFLLGTALLLVLAEWQGKRTRKMDTLTWLDALLIGLFQIISLFPGISRSGATMTGGMVRNLDRTTAARFSFLMSIPVMLGAGGVAVLDLVRSSSLASMVLPLLVGFVVAAIVGYLSIRWLLAYLTKRSFHLFAAYCVLASLLVLTIVFIRA
jgi:undecaprenyl-diphosphatase